MIRGVIVGKRAVDDRPERGLLAAVVLQAIADARGGDLEAGQWLDDVAGMVRAALGVDVRDWRALVQVAPQRRIRRIKPAPSGAERSKAYRAKKRLERLGQGEMPPAKPAISLPDVADYPQ
jgi:hypothetical protein